MPRAGGSITPTVKYAYQDHDADVQFAGPPVQNTWYEVFQALDVRLLRCVVVQNNTENDPKDIEVRWTIDGNVYFVAGAIAEATRAFIYRNRFATMGGTAGLTIDTVERNAGYSIDKRGHDFKVEVRMTSIPGTNQTLQTNCVRETLEET